MNTERLKRWSARALLVLSGAFLLTLFAEPADAQVVRITVRLSGAQEVPPVTTRATGIARLTVNTATRSIRGRVNFTGLSTPATAGHIHMGVAGRNGPVLIPLVGGVGVRTGVMSVPPGTVLPLAQMRALRTNRLYLNVHTSRNPGGEIRGQIRFPRTAALTAQTPLLSPSSGSFNLVQTRDRPAILNPGPGLVLSLGRVDWMDASASFIQPVKRG